MINRVLRNLSIAGIILVLSVQPVYCQTGESKLSEIKPCTLNPHYWQYKGERLLLLGASNDDNLFQASDKTEQLDRMIESGGNYIRNSMRSRDEGDIFPFMLLENGKYDLDQWNAEYWCNFEILLREAYQRDIIVQIEFWDLHDLHGNNWLDSPWNPANNVNYREEQTTLLVAYPPDAMITKHDFFFTVPALAHDNVVLAYQKKFFNKVINYTFEYPNILYCISNEMFPTMSPEWGWYWATYIKEQALAAGKDIYVTEMFWDPEMRGLQHRASLERPDIYDFFEASQNSSSVHGRHNWEKSVWLLEYMKNTNPRPINHVKIYGNDLPPDGIEDHDALARFWRNILAGAASSRFHRPASGFGLGLIPRTMAHLTSARKLLEAFDIFNAKPDYHHSLLSNRQNNEAYLSYIADEAYAVYFPYGGEVGLDLSENQGTYQVKWLKIDGSEWTEATMTEGGQIIPLSSPLSSHALALVVKVN